MDWRIKAAIQNTLARLPPRLSYSAYYWLQRRYGALRQINPRSQIQAAIQIAHAIQENGGSLPGKTCMEIGTGRRLNLPLVMWLLGTDRVITVDLNNYLKYELIADDIVYIQSNTDQVLQNFDGLDYQASRLSQLLEFDTRKQSLDDLLTLANIHYEAPADARNLTLKENSIHYHVSSNVFEHIPREILVEILCEGSRIMSEQGLFVHCIDHSDHFSHIDKTVLAVNFMQYNDRQWDRLAGNRYMYMNRLQVDDFEDIFSECDHEVLQVKAEPDSAILQKLHSSAISLNIRFANKPAETLATLSSMFVSRPSSTSKLRSESSAA